MTLFKDVFQRHLAQKENAAANPDADAMAHQTGLVHDAPLASIAPPSLDPPTAQTHEMLPSESGAAQATIPTAPQLSETLDPDLVARASEAQRLIAEHEALRNANPVPAAPAADGDAPTRPNAARTRLLGFGDAGSAYVDPLNDLNESPRQPQFPCGWLVIVAGPGRGASFALHPGIAQIGRGDDQTISLDFGDRTISRERHAVVAYDPESKQFFLAHGGKSNIIRLNDRPVLGTEEMTHGNTVTIGETVLRFAAFCDQTFHWSEAES